jgi:hypothetical protein
MLRGSFPAPLLYYGQNKKTVKISYSPKSAAKAAVNMRQICFTWLDPNETCRDYLQH